VGSYCVYVVSQFLVTNSSLKGNFPSDVSSRSTSNAARSLSLVNALSACCLSTWLPSNHRQWSAVELVKTLASVTKRKGRNQVLDACISADLQGTSHVLLICLFVVLFFVCLFQVISTFRTIELQVSFKWMQYCCLCHMSDSFGTVVKTTWNILHRAASVSWVTWLS